jgi:hypothetical protein
MSLENKLAAEIRAYNEGRPTMTPDQFDAEFEAFWKRAGLFEEIAAERERQDAKWGEQNHDPFKWCVILGEEVGEVNRAVCELYDWKSREFSGDPREYRAEERRWHRVYSC